jgi:hypothetical protein
MLMLVSFLPAVVGIIGCPRHEPVRGCSQSAQPSAATAEIGKDYVDFTFKDSGGITQPFDQKLGDFTVLALTRCDQPTHAVADKLLRTIVDANRNVSGVSVVGYDIHWSPNGCGEHGQCQMVPGEPYVGSICDTTGAIHRAYGDHAEDWLYVIGPDKKIEFAAPATRGAQVSRELAAKIQQLSVGRFESTLSGADFPY